MEIAHNIYMYTSLTNIYVSNNLAYLNLHNDKISLIYFFVIGRLINVYGYRVLIDS